MDEVLFCAQIPDYVLPSHGASQFDRAYAAVKYAENNNIELSVYTRQKAASPPPEPPPIQPKPAWQPPAKNRATLLSEIGQMTSSEFDALTEKSGINRSYLPNNKSRIEIAIVLIGWMKNKSDGLAVLSRLIDEVKEESKRMKAV